LLAVAAVFLRWIARDVGTHDNFACFPVGAIVVVFAVVRLHWIVNAHADTGRTVGITGRALWTRKTADVIAGTIVVFRAFAGTGGGFLARSLAGFAGGIGWTGRAGAIGDTDQGGRAIDVGDAGHAVLPTDPIASAFVA